VGRVTCPEGSSLSTPATMPFLDVNFAAQDQSDGCVGILEQHVHANISGDLMGPEEGVCAALSPFHAAVTRLVFVFMSLCMGWEVDGEAECLVSVMVAVLRIDHAWWSRLSIQ
jgi:hypothetical protein